MPNYYAAGGTWTRPELDIFSSEAGKAIRPATIDASYVDADDNGDKILYEGTTLEASPVDADLYKPSDGTGTLKGVVKERHNLRTGNAEVAMVVGGRLHRAKLWHNGNFGQPSAGSQGETDLRAMGIFLDDVDV